MCHKEVFGWVQKCLYKSPLAPTSGVPSSSQKKIEKIFLKKYEKKISQPLCWRLFSRKKKPNPLLCGGHEWLAHSRFWCQNPRKNWMGNEGSKFVKIRNLEYDCSFRCKFWSFRSSRVAEKSSASQFSWFLRKIQIMGKAWVYIQIPSIYSYRVPCNIVYHGIPNEVLAPVQVDNAGCLLGGNYKAPMVIISKNKSGLVSNVHWNWIWFIWRKRAQTVRCADQNWLETRT